MKKIFFAFLISCLTFPSGVSANHPEKLNHEFKQGNKGLRCRKHLEDTSSSVDSDSDKSCKKQKNKKGKKGKVDIGYSAEATLGTGIVWSSLNYSPSGDEKQYMLQLKKGWKDSSGDKIPSEILPESLGAIAKVTKRTNSGIFSMEITQIIYGDFKIPFPRTEQWCGDGMHPKDIS